MFELSKSQKQIVKAARDFAKGEFDKDLAYELEKSRTFPIQVWEKAADLGFIGIHYPEDHGGGGLGLLENVLITEELCHQDSALGYAISHAGFASECLALFASDEIKSRVLPQIAEGKALSGAAFSETQLGAIPLALQTSAVEQNGKWVINGEKTYVINGGAANYYILLCQTDLSVEPADKGRSLILVEADSPGIKVVDCGKNLGGNMVNTADLIFENVRVPASNLIGKIGKGTDYIQRYFDDSRIMDAAQAVGIAAGALDRTLEYTKGRVQFNRRIIDFQVTRHKIAEMATQIELSRIITYKAAWIRDNGKTDSKLCSMAKMTAAQTAVNACNHAIQMFGGYGYMTEYEVERFYRDARMIENSSGNNHIQKDIIAAGIVGKN